MPGSETETRVGHCKDDDVDQYVGRGPGGANVNSAAPVVRGWLGNPYSLDDHSREASIEKFREDFEERLARDTGFRDAVEALSGQVLGCWCQRLEDDGPACHGEVIAEWADRLAAGEQPDIPSLETDGGVPDHEDDIMVRRARLEPGLGEGDDDEDPELVSDGGTDRSAGGSDHFRPVTNSAGEFLEMELYCPQAGQQHGGVIDNWEFCPYCGRPLHAGNDRSGGADGE